MELLRRCFCSSEHDDNTAEESYVCIRVSQCDDREGKKSPLQRTRFFAVSTSVTLRRQTFTRSRHSIKVARGQIVYFLSLTCETDNRFHVKCPTASATPSVITGSPLSPLNAKAEMRLKINRSPPLAELRKNVSQQ